MSSDSNDPANNDLNLPSNPQVNDEEGIQGSMTDPDIAEGDYTLDEAHNEGLYRNADEEHPAELNLAEQVQDAEDFHKKND